MKWYGRPAGVTGGAVYFLQLPLRRRLERRLMRRAGPTARVAEDAWPGVASRQPQLELGRQRGVARWPLGDGGLRDGRALRAGVMAAQLFPAPRELVAAAGAVSPHARS